MKNILVFSCVLIMLTGCPFGFAQDNKSSTKPKDIPKSNEKEVPDKVKHAPNSLEYFMAQAALKNQSLKAAYNEWQAALQKVYQVTQLPYPKFSYNYYIQEVETRVGPQRHKFGISQGFPFPGKLKQAGKVMAAEAEVARLEFDALKFAVYESVKQSFYEYDYLNKTIKITEENIVLLESYNKIIEAKIKVNAATQGTLLKAQAELDVLKNKLKKLQSMRKPIAARLNSLIDEPIDKKIDWPELFNASFIKYDKKELSLWTTQQAPIILVAKQKYKKAIEAVALSKFEGKPKFMFGVNWIETGHANMNVDDNGKDPVIAMFEIEIPLWRKKAHAARDEALFNLVAAKAKNKDVENTLLTKLEMILFNLDDAERQYNLYTESIIPKTEQALKLLEQNYAAGKADFLSLLDTHRMLIMYRTNKDKAYKDYWQNVASIEALTGRTLKEK